MIILSDFQSLQDYFKAIAEDHKELDTTEPYLFGDNDVAQNKVKTWNGKKLWLSVPDIAQLEDLKSDNLLLREPCTMYIGGAAGTVPFQKEYDYYKECKSLMVDVVSHIRKDYDAGNLVFDFSSIRMGWAEMMMGATKFTFCRMDFSYKDATGFVYNPLKWKSED